MTSIPMTDTREDVLKQLNQFRSLNGGAGPVVPKWMADKLRSLSITEGYVETKPLPLFSEEP